MKFLLPFVLLLLGTGGGVGAAMMLRSDDPLPEGDAALDGTGPCGPLDDVAADPGPDHDTPVEDYDYVRLDNQFVVPVVTGDAVTAMVVMSASVEVPAGEQDIVYDREPKLRDAILQVLFDHSNAGGFAGNFTSATRMADLRAALSTAARSTLGSRIGDILILEIVRQDIAG